MIDSISGLDDDYIYSWLKSLESVTVSIVGFINDYADRNELNGTCFKEDNTIDIQSINELLLEQLTEREHTNADIYVLGKQVNILVQAIKQLDNKIKEKQC